MLKFGFSVSIVVLSLFVFTSLTFAYTLPRDNTKAEYLYVFGSEGDTNLGAHGDKHEQVVFINVPENEARALAIDIYDADTGGTRDLRPSPEDEWDTEVEFSVYGKSSTPLASKVFDASGEYDRKYYAFGLFNKEEGVKIGDIYQFKVVVRALKGNDQNLFRLRITPESCEAFSEKISFRLLPNEGDKMYFYVGIPADISRIIVENYDLDPDGGEATLEDPLSRKISRIPGSASAQWASTPLSIVASEQPRRLVYTITKKTQRYANAAVRVKDEKGNLLPLYYKRGTPVAVAQPAQPVKVAPAKVSPDFKCNKFTFDATKSFDPNNEKLSYLWDFGDGQTSTEPVVTHLYQDGGDYTVKLTVKDTSGLECDTSVTSQDVKVNTPPQAYFKGPDSACTGSSVMFDASASTDNTPGNLTYTWNFGDGTKGEGKTVSKTYEKGGTYKVLLNVNDNSGTPCSTSSSSKTININSVPVANAGEDINMCIGCDDELTAKFNAGASHDPDGDKLTYTWDFGDGETASGKTVSHIYKKEGKHVVNLTVDDGKNSGCSTASDRIEVVLNRQPIADAGKEITTCAGENVEFDGSASQGSNLTYTWDFGDGSTGNGVKSSHRYVKGGNYNVTLKVDDRNGTKCSTAISNTKVFVNAGPIADLRTPSNACVGEKVSFDASGSRDPDGNALTYIWDFGDGTEVKAGSNVSHVYTKGGNYTVKVKVGDGTDSQCCCAVATTSVKINTPPVADAGPNLVCCVDKVSTFDASNSNDPDSDMLTYNWNFGDGSTAEGARVTHAYTKSGKYTVTLKVSDNSGTSCSTATSSFEARVNDAPVSVIKVR